MAEGVRSNKSCLSSRLTAHLSTRANCPHANGSQKRFTCCARRSGQPDSVDKSWNTSIKDLRKDFKWRNRWLAVDPRNARHWSLSTNTRRWK